MLSHAVDIDCLTAGALRHSRIILSSVFSRALATQEILSQHLVLAELFLSASTLLTPLPSTSLRLFSLNSRSFSGFLISSISLFAQFICQY